MAGNGKKAEPLHIILLVLFVIAYIFSAIRPLGSAGLDGSDDACAPARIIAGCDLPEVPFQHLRLCDGFSACFVVGVRRALYLFPESFVQSMERTVRLGAQLL